MGKPFIMVAVHENPSAALEEITARIVAVRDSL